MTATLNLCGGYFSVDKVGCLWITVNENGFSVDNFVDNFRVVDKKQVSVDK